MAQKSCRKKGKTLRAGDFDHCTGGRIVRQNTVSSPAVRLASPPHGSRYKNVKPIVVLCIRRPATGPLSGGAAPRPHYPGNGKRGHVGLDRGDVGLAAGRRYSRHGPGRIGSTFCSASGRPTADGREL